MSQERCQRKAVVDRRTDENDQLSKTHSFSPLMRQEAQSIEELGNDFTPKTTPIILTSRQTLGKRLKSLGARNYYGLEPEQASQSEDGNFDDEYLIQSNAHNLRYLSISDHIATNLYDTQQQIPQFHSRKTTTDKYYCQDTKIRFGNSHWFDNMSANQQQLWQSIFDHHCSENEDFDIQMTDKGNVKQLILFGEKLRKSDGTNFITTLLLTKLATR